MSKKVNDLSNLEPEGGPFRRQWEFIRSRLGIVDQSPKELQRKGAKAGIPDLADRVKQLAVQRVQALAMQREMQKQAYKKEQTQMKKEPKGPTKSAEKKWIPIGPSAVRRGPGPTMPVVSGRCPGIAVAPGGLRVYAATANGGVWRSEDGGRSWVSLMEGFDENPTTFKSDSLACGAIALHPGSNAAGDRIYVGTGEGPTASFQTTCYFGVGPIASKTTNNIVEWEKECPDLCGTGFYSLVVDPNNPEIVVAANTTGIYTRKKDEEGTWKWVKEFYETSDMATSVVLACRNGEKCYYAAVRKLGIFKSNTGDDWQLIGHGPLNYDQRIALAVQPNDKKIVYAFTEEGKIFRLDRDEDEWREVIIKDPFIRENQKNLFVKEQGGYDLAIAIKPDDVNQIFIGGCAVESDREGNIRKPTGYADQCGALYRCTITVKSEGGKIQGVEADVDYIGASVHPDIHTIVFTPDNPNEMWVGCDGGIFHTILEPQKKVQFEARNNGLQTLSMTYLTIHPERDEILFCGTQDNGGLRYDGEECWLTVSQGDNGCSVVNWANTNHVLFQSNRFRVKRFINGGNRGPGYSYRHTISDSPQSVKIPEIDSPGMPIYAPIAGPPINSDNIKESNIVAWGGDRVWISCQFGGNWEGTESHGDWKVISVGLCNIFSLVFASTKKLYAGGQKDFYKATMISSFSCKEDSVCENKWIEEDLSKMLICNTDGEKLSKRLGYNAVSCVVVDPANEENGIYITLKGPNEVERVWHFNGECWAPKSNNLIKTVQHNTIAVEPEYPNVLYVGTDIGVWRSPDGGDTWEVFSNGLPDTPIWDLKINPRTRILYAATHGRGVFAIPLDEDVQQQEVELFLRRTDGADIRIDVPNKYGKYQFPLDTEYPMDFVQFSDLLDSDLKTITTEKTGAPDVKIYVQVHNRGIGVAPADNVKAMLLMAKLNAIGELPELPENYQEGFTKDVTGNGWQKIGIAQVDKVKTGFPQVAVFDLPSSYLPKPAALDGKDEYCLMVLLHHENDSFPTDSGTTPSDLIKDNRKVAIKTFRVITSGEDIKLLQRGFIAVPPAATAAGAPLDTFLFWSFAKNDALLEAKLRSVYAAPRLGSRTETIQNEPVTNPSPVELIETDYIVVKDDGITLTESIPLVWIAREKITISAKIDAYGRGSSTRGDFGGSGGAGSGTDGNNCILPKLNYPILEGGKSSDNKDGSPLTADWASRILAQWPHAKGGAAGGGTGGGKGGGIVILCAPEIVFEGEGKIDVSGSDGQNGSGGGGGGLVVLIAKKISPGDFNINNITLKGGTGTGKGGDGYLLIHQYDK